MGGNLPLAIFSDRDAVPRGVPWIPLLVPFWGIPETEAAHLDGNRFEELAARGREFLELVPMREAEIVVAPVEWGSDAANGAVRRIVEEAGAEGKPCVVWSNSDSEAELPITGATVFRTSIRRSRRQPHEFALPGWSADLLMERAGGVEPRPWRERPTVGYTGYVDWSRVGDLPRHAVRRLLRGRHPGAAVRGAAVRALSRARGVETRFRIREGCLTGSAPSAQRLEYVEAILGSDYSLVARGGGNFSYRLYEVLSCGRIPIFVDTDCVLPFDDRIDWRRLLCWVDERDVGRIEDRVLEFHHALGRNGFEERQREVRRLWEEALCPLGFCRTMAGMLRSRVR